MQRSEEPGLPKFAIDDKVKAKRGKLSGPVTGIGPEVVVAGRTTRRIYWLHPALGELWDWDYDLEAW